MRLIRSKLFWIGAALFVLGSGPLIGIILFADLGLSRDLNPNPIGPGILAGITFWPSVIMIGIAILRSCISGRRDEAARMAERRRSAESALQSRSSS